MDPIVSKFSGQFPRFSSCLFAFLRPEAPEPHLIDAKPARGRSVGTGGDDGSHPIFGRCKFLKTCKGISIIFPK